MKVYQFFSMRDRQLVDNAFYHLSISLSIPEIFAVKIESCLKSQQILDIYCLPKFLGGGATKKLYAG